MVALRTSIGSKVMLGRHVFVIPVDRVDLVVAGGSSRPNLVCVHSVVGASTGTIPSLDAIHIHQCPWSLDIALDQYQ